MKKRVAKVLTLAVVVAAPFALPRPSSLDAASAVAAPTNFRFSAGVLITEQTRAGKGLHYMWFPAAGGGRQQLCQLVRLLLVELASS